MDAPGAALTRLLNRPVLDQSVLNGGTIGEMSTSSFGSGIDYTSSRFHNTLLGKADTSLVVSETIRAQNEKRAFEKAKEEELKRNIEKAQQENKNLQNAQNAKQRGLKAMEKIVAQRDVKVFEKEMKQVQVSEGMAKIEKLRKQ